VKWYHGDERIKPKKGERRLRSGYDNNSDLYVLQIQSAVIEDSGLYSVKISNEHGSAKANVSVNIIKEPNQELKQASESIHHEAVVVESEKATTSFGSPFRQPLEQAPISGPSNNLNPFSNEPIYYINDDDMEKEDVEDLQTTSESFQKEKLVQVEDQPAFAVLSSVSRDGGKESINFEGSTEIISGIISDTEQVASQGDSQQSVAGRGSSPVLIEKPQSVSALDGTPFVLFCKVQG